MNNTRLDLTPTHFWVGPNGKILAVAIGRCSNCSEKAVGRLAGSVLDWRRDLADPRLNNLVKLDQWPANKIYDKGCTRNYNGNHDKLPE